MMCRDTYKDIHDLAMRGSCRTAVEIIGRWRTARHARTVQEQNFSMHLLVRVEWETTPARRL